MPVAHLRIVKHEARPHHISLARARHRDGSVMQHQSKAGRAAEAASRISEHERAVIIAENPVLAEYLAWKRLHPGRELEDCLKEKFRR